jgi:hypothetical protein
MEMDAMKLAGRLGIQAPTSALMLSKYAIKLLEIKEFHHHAQQMRLIVKAWYFIHTHDTT